MRKVIHGITLECVCGDITAQTDMMAIVNAANPDLEAGSGVSGAMHRAAGLDLYEECRRHAPIAPGEAVITQAFNLPSKYVIHCLAPVYESEVSSAVLANCYRNVFRLAEENAIKSIALPAIATDFLGYPLKAAAAVALNTTLGLLTQLRYIKYIRFVADDAYSLWLHEGVLDKLAA